MRKTEEGCGDYSVRDLQKALLKILVEIDRICVKYDIRYALFAGSALGAVRHGGFVPWDDDIDIILTRGEYERFIKAAKKEIDADSFFLQEEYSEHWPMHYTKVRMNGTTYMERFIPLDKETHQGIFVDVFPCDLLCDFRPLRLLQFVGSKVIIAKNLSLRGYRTKSKAKKIFMSICSKLPTDWLNSFVRGDSWVDAKMLHSFFGASSRYRRSVYPRDVIENTKLMEFEGMMLPVSANCDQLLTILYGDYMMLPSSDQIAEKVHGVVVDLENSYEHHLDEQREMHFSTYAKSIR